ncbi:hypothetical protein CHLNCDRAFT_145269 [Chlorella variabilis]|uniref:CobW/HypB/UreG nucleotide-binding domain-containing protein n=1 Tax=Chlorella variabilis TaxID=554065 RepID=E1ZE25_CHLVA|nr:hypothetical protein CHLNCDRAFT_145269 [Chlorella variabilis]EFN55957.1 hypothetical protein CHLNCDRAFT_145269 [Chlorella variabilis]|eukprot:XP_005848059.1 hypothetical protein CHLNCDRAFT_145269 [Chlorella variabilis]
MSALGTMWRGVPVTIVTGALAAGKTTMVASLLRCKPANEVWACLLNEFGAAGLDAALLEGEAAAVSGGGSIIIHQLAGGCLCCVLSNVTPLAIAQLLRRVKPDRLIIEPSGLAHPATLLDMLQGEHLGSSLAVQPVVDATQFVGGTGQPACLSSQLLANQISVADVLVGSKADMCNSDTLRAFQRWAEQLFPPKQLVTTARHGCLADAVTAAMFPGLTASSGDGAQQPAAAAERQQQQQQQLLVPSCLRVKGVFRMAAARWEAVSAAPGPFAAAAAAPETEAVTAPVAVELREMAYRADSRVEIILGISAATSPAACPSGGSNNDRREQQASSSSLADDASSVELRVAKALGAAAAGDWALLQALLLATLQEAQGA